MSLVDKQWQFLKNVSKLINYAEDTGVILTGGELYRTVEQQKIHFDAGRSKTMKSNHMKRLAIDFNFFIDGELVYDHKKITELGNFWKSLNPKNEWGGFWAFKDVPHFEMLE